MKAKRGYYDVFVRSCARYPSNIAVRLYNNGVYLHYTYSELYGICEYISQNLQQLKCNKGVIGVLSQRNIIIPCVLAATHKCSTTFMFLDPSQDIEDIVKTIKFNVIITIDEADPDTTSELLNKKPDKSVTFFNLMVNFYNMVQYARHGNNIHAIEHSYIAMTSGSTGEPKHIQVPIQCLQPNIDDLTKMFDISHKDIIYFSTPLTFDPSMIEILLACINGASLLIAPEKAEILFPENGENCVTCWQTTPSKFFQYTNVDIKNKILNANSMLRILALGGEPLNGLKRLKQLKDCNNKTRIFTLYGVTEMSCWACAAELDLNHILTDREIPLGECLSETQLVVQPVDQNKNTGKIILGNKTRKCIILNKRNGSEEENSLKFIDTGDYGETKNGITYYRGRKDDTIKRFGHKVNLQLIETTIMQCPRVKTCSCIWLPKPMLLVVYYSSETLSSQELSDFLKCKLDDKHWPDKVIRADTLPTNSHGKLSKRILTQMCEKNLLTPKSSDTLRESFLLELKFLLHRNFKYEDIKDKDFFSIGGTSFLAIALCNKLSLTHPQFANIILSHLISQKDTIEEIFRVAQKELGVEEKKTKKRIRRSSSNSVSFVSTSKSYKKRSDSPINPVDFAVIWSYDTGKCVDASPTLFKTKLNVYVTVGSHSGKILVVDAITGILQGVIKLKSRIEASVLCYEDENIPACGMVGTYDGTVACFALESCEEIWKINVGAMIKSKGVCCKGLFYVASYDGNIRSIDITTGEIKQSIYICDQAISADLVLAKNQYILLGTLGGACACFHTETKTILWRCTLSSPVFANPVVYDTEKYVVFAEVNGEIHCRTVEKGIKIWKYQGAKGNIFSSLYMKEIEKLKWQFVFGCHDSKVYSVYIKNFQPSLHWKAQLTSPVYATPCHLNYKYLLAVSNNGTIFIIEEGNGNIIGEYQLPNEVFSSPAVYGSFGYPLFYRRTANDPKTNPCYENGMK
ncbi:beta-alanine-activating enzyme isoform X2 [Epargyreus clarus]|uniref:beta-alanine-activating enzyme isoform X2 n=1 Tax=Epargyreus clarus TaxID=520877 RepID=UPI003C2DD984